ncbi:ubiquitin thioesterase otu1 [Phtheirospermum japonicum]|uniref:Ubiquitin thioesterase OTU n=1 Tax=Phtheirospermum japonicum TaxID=374723 RepID=A0A830C0Q2_9LAMI|nr:ubiquitin thioesterase otu1 [Phtheirospermum japonicum]
MTDFLPPLSKVADETCKGSETPSSTGYVVVCLPGAFVYSVHHCFCMHLNSSKNVGWWERDPTFVGWWYCVWGSRSRKNICVRHNLDLQLSPRFFSVNYLRFKMEGIVVRRVIPSDNSCLFNAVGYVMDHDKNKASELRQCDYWHVRSNVTFCDFKLVKVIAATVASDPDKYSEAFLGKTNEEYCAWILNPEKWGGAIELAILADYYGREIAAYDIQTTRCDLYGQEKNFEERVMLMYDGLHYDALAMSPFEGAPGEFDQTIFAVRKDRTVGPVEGLTLNLVRDQHRKRSFTDTSNFTLRCAVCQIGVVGQKEAVEHAQATGHANFQEFR